MSRLDPHYGFLDVSAARVANFSHQIAEIPAIKRGLVWCTVCGREQATNAANNLRTGGWPKCCGVTMTIDSPEERASRG
jgi:hypothetical protein